MLGLRLKEYYIKSGERKVNKGNCCLMCGLGSIQSKLKVEIVGNEEKDLFFNENYKE